MFAFGVRPTSWDEKTEIHHQETDNMPLVGIGKTDNNALAGGTASCRKSDKREPDSSIEAASYFRWKSILDRVLAAVLLVPGIPVIGLAIASIRLTSKGPGIYRQTRVGKGGRSFTMYKIRSMRQDAENGTGPVWTAENDDRITRVGRFLRKSHLDELPQLFNVLKGEMSLIGPRPERPEFVALLSQEIPNYLDRLTVKPGITGLAQINLDPDVDIESVRRKLVLDSEYIRNATVFFDARMLLTTSLYLVGYKPESAKRLTRLKRGVPRLSSCVLSDGDDVTPNSETQPTPARLSLRIVGGDRGKNGSGSEKHQTTPHERTSANSPTNEAARLKPR